MGQQSKFIGINNGWPSIDIGAMRHAITIKSNGPASPPVYDASGISPQIATFTTAMAAIDAIRGDDVIKGGQTTSQLFLMVAMWFQAGIIGGMQVFTDNGSVYVIQSVDNILEMNAVLQLNCVALGTNG